MSDRPRLNADGEAAWLRFKQHLEWCDGFALIFVFSDRPEVSATFRERLSAIHRAQITGLMLETPQNPGDLLNRILPRLIRRRQLREAMKTPVWIDLTQPQDSIWNAALEQFLTLLNAQREPLRAALPQPLVLEFTTANKAEIRSLVPDLWAIRHLVLETGPWLTDRLAESTSPAPPEPLPLGNDGLSALREWQRLRDRGATDRGALIAAERAFTMLRLAVRLDSAQAVARWMVEQSRARGESPEALRDLSVSLNNLGNIDRDLRRFDDARNAFDESLAISERLAAALPDQPEFVEARDWLRQQIAELPPSVSTDATG